MYDDLLKEPFWFVFVVGFVSFGVCVIIVTGVFWVTSLIMPHPLYAGIALATVIVLLGALSVKLTA